MAQDNLIQAVNLSGFFTSENFPPFSDIHVVSTIFKELMDPLQLQIYVLKFLACPQKM
jgi:hypothetical protein